MTMYDIPIIALIDLLIVVLAVKSVSVLVARVFRRTRPTCAEFVLALSMTGLLVAILIANLIKAQPSSSRCSCFANLVQIQGAKHTWALEMHKAPTDVPTDSDLIGSEMYLKKKPVCPAGGTYTMGAVGEKPRCSFGGPGHTI